MNHSRTAYLLALVTLACVAEGQQPMPAEPGVAAANRAVLSQLPFADRQEVTDFRPDRRDCGFEAAEGACCIAAPIRDHTAAVVAAISASMMANRFYRWREVRLAAMLKAAAGRFSDSLGYDPKTERLLATAPRVP